ncbi:MAG: hypothetical protein AAGK02_13865 [Pseudomonadota bacterium]
MKRLLSLFALLFAFTWTTPALAAVEMHFHSFNGSVLVGRYPHTFIVLEGKLSNGTVVNENFGFSARKVTPAILNGPVEHMVLAEKAKTIPKTNRHFTVTLNDAQYRRIKREVLAWKNAPGKYYDLERRNCIHFVGAMARIVGLEVEYPNDMLRRPKAWLNHVTALNPRLGAAQVR